MTTTDDLIARLAIQPPLPALNTRRIAGTALLAIVMSVALFLSVEGIRPRLAQAWGADSRQDTNDANAPRAGIR